MKKTALLLAALALLTACGETLEQVTQATWWKTKEAMCGAEMRESRVEQVCR